MNVPRGVMIAVDVGATNVRARLVTVAHTGHAAPLTGDITERMGSASALYEFVREVVRTAQPYGELTAAVVAVAGMVDGDCCRITNWSTDSLIEVDRLAAAGLPAGRTQLVNDVVAGVWGALARVGGEAGGLGKGNLVYLAPGTGLGAAALVRHGLGPLGGTVVACEAQHTQIPRFEGEIARTIDAIAHDLGRAPTWEELVSGPGLARVYQAQRAITGAAMQLMSADASEIAEAAHRGRDAQALSAVHVYYEALGYFAQMLALAYLPCATVVLGGASTQHNLELLHGSAFAQTFAEHPHFGAVLGSIPVHTVDGEVNLEGGLWLAARLSSPVAP